MMTDESRQGSRLRAFTDDLAAAWRALQGHARFLVMSVATLGVGVALSTVLLSVYDTVVLKAAAFKDPARLVFVQYTTGATEAPSALSYPAFHAIADNTRLFERAAYYASPRAITLGTGDAAEILFSVRVSPAFFETLGVPPLHGRALDAADAAAGREAAVVIAFDLWQRRFGGDPSVVGRTVLIDGKPAWIVGVMPARFRYPSASVRVWSPDAVALGARDDHAHHGHMVLARLQSGITLDQVKGRLPAIAADLHRIRPDVYPQPTFIVAPLRDQVIGPIAGLMTVLLGAVGCVMLVCCANLANLLLLRHTARERLLAIRAALGASTGRLWQLLLCESLIIGALAALVGFSRRSEASRSCEPGGLARSPGFRIWVSRSPSWRLRPCSPSARRCSPP